MSCPPARGSRLPSRLLTALALAGLAGLLWASGLIDARSNAPTDDRALAATEDRDSLLTTGSTRTTVGGRSNTRPRRQLPATRTPTRAPAPKSAVAPAPLPPPPEPPAPEPPAPTPEELCAQGVASVAWPVGWHVSCRGTRPGLLGLTSPSGSTYVYVRGPFTADDYRSTALHEAGHAWAFRELNAHEQEQWCAARGCSANRWLAGGAHGSDWREPPVAEDWAESWRFCHGGPYARAYLGLGAPNADLCARQRALVG